MLTLVRGTVSLIHHFVTAYVFAKNLESRLTVLMMLYIIYK